jgi:hypothetical protein
VANKKKPLLPPLLKLLPRLLLPRLLKPLLLLPRLLTLLLLLPRLLTLLPRLLLLPKLPLPSNRSAS